MCAVSGRSPVDCGKQERTRSLLTVVAGTSLHLVADRANDPERRRLDQTLRGTEGLDGASPGLPVLQERRSLNAPVHAVLTDRDYVVFSRLQAIRRQTISGRAGS